MRQHKKVPSVNQQLTILYLVCGTALVSILFFYIQSFFFMDSHSSDRNSKTIHVLDLLKTEFKGEVDSDDVVFRDNEPPINEKYAKYVSLKKDFRLVVRGDTCNMIPILNEYDDESNSAMFYFIINSLGFTLELLRPAQLVTLISSLLGIEYEVVVGALHNTFIVFHQLGTLIR
ncbi:Sialyltransferase-like protein 1, partial [Mucuna pruriens]